MTQPTSKGDNNLEQGDPQAKPEMGSDGPREMNAYALLIGVGRCEYSVWSLPETVLDVLELRRTLADPDLCAYPGEHVRTLSDEAATREGILAAVAELAQAAAADPDATFLIYYSGHGWLETGVGGERYFLIPSDVRPHELTSTALPAKDFIQGLRSLRSRRVLAIFDTCHASAAVRDLAMAPIPKGFVEEPLPRELVYELGTGGAVVLSCHATQKSWTLPGEGGLSIFARHLVAALRGGGSAQGGRFVTISSLMRYLSKAVPESARRIGREQIPFFKFETEDFPVALIRGGKGRSAAGGESPVSREEPAPPGGSKITIGGVTAGRDIIFNIAGSAIKVSDVRISIDTSRIFSERPPARHVNIWLKHYDNGWEEVRQLEPLRACTPYKLHVDIGPLSPRSSVVNPLPIPPDAFEPLFRKGGDWVQIAVYSHDFELGLVQTDREDPAQAVSEEACVMHRLWLPAVAPSPVMNIEVMPREAGQAFLRLCVYYRNQLLQSLGLKARVGPESGEVPSVPGAPDGYETRIEYTVSTDFRELSRLPPRAVALFTNKLGDTHTFGMKVGAWNESSGHGENWTFVADLKEAALAPRLQAIRDTLDKIGTTKVRGKEYYAFNSAAKPDLPLNAADPAMLQAALKRLAKQGALLFRDLFPVKARLRVREVLAEPGQSILIARLLSEGDVLPWTVIYDRQLDPAIDPMVCLEPLKHVDEKGRLAYRACGGGACPLTDDNRNRVVCPWGFWGIKHILEQPPQQVSEETRKPHDLVQEIEVKDAPRVSMNVSTRLDSLDVHRMSIEGLPHICFSLAGDDRIHPPSGRDQVLKELRREDLHFIYFYCHGGKTQGDWGFDRPCLSVGSSEQPYILPDSLPDEDQWLERPLVFLNACRSVGLEPELLGGFVQAFVDHGAAGVIGTEVRVWEPLATAFAERFLEKFLACEPVGMILRDLRHELLRCYNPLGLVYTNYCSADLHLILPAALQDD